MFITTSLHSGTPVPENVICGVSRGAQGKRKETTTSSHSLGFGAGRVKSSAGVLEEELSSLGGPGDFVFSLERLCAEGKGALFPAASG